MEEETIAAISTPLGMGGIGIVRISGEKAFETLFKIFKSKEYKKTKDIEANKIVYGHIYDGDELVDEVLVSFFKAPHSYTTEDVVEINSHGGNIVVKKILGLCIKNGAKLAKSGEFTKRAFINGRIDLSQVESIGSILGAKSEEELRISNELLKGKLSKEIATMKKNLLDILMNIEVVIDYPEYDTEEKEMKDVVKVLTESKNKLTQFVGNFDVGTKIKEGIEFAIIGTPNVGKSSILNLILDEERAIVTDIEGTTRDSIEESINLKGIPVRIIDTAGIRKTDEKVEQIGIKKSREIANKADIVVGIFDSSRELREDDKEILKLCEEKESIIVINKTDLEAKIDINEIKKKNKHVIEMSAVNNKGIDDLLDLMHQIASKLIETKSDDVIVIHERQKNIIQRTLEAMEEALEMTSVLPIDMVSEYIEGIVSILNEFSGEDIKEELLNEIFANFCLGK